MQNNVKYDVVIIGGSYAGLSAAMTLGRAVRKVLVIDSGNPCNRPTPHSHNFLTQDGRTPTEITLIAKCQVIAYPTVEFLEDEVTAVKGDNNNYEVLLKTGNIIQGRKLLFATGVKDLMPSISGFAECWGISVIHCPYCHGYEFEGRQTGILMNGDIAYETGRLISNWTDKLTVFTNGNSSINTEHQAKLSALKINIVEKSIKEIAHSKGYLSHIIFADNSTFILDALYARPSFEQHCQIPLELGCAIDDMGYLKVDDFQQTTVLGIYAAGDNATMYRAVSNAVASGTKAGAFINHELIREHTS